MLTTRPNADVITMILASIWKSPSTILTKARYTRMPVTTQMSSTDVRAPMTSALYQPKDIFFVAGLVAIHREKRLIMKLAKSVSKWAASVAIAKLFDK